MSLGAGTADVDVDDDFDVGEEDENEIGLDESDICDECEERKATHMTDHGRVCSQCFSALMVEEAEEMSQPPVEVPFESTHERDLAHRFSAEDQSDAEARREFQSKFGKHQRQDDAPAYIRSRTTIASGGTHAVEVWSWTQNPEHVLQADAADLMFLPTDATYEQVFAAFLERYPPSAPWMLRFRFTGDLSNHPSRYFFEPGGHRSFRNYVSHSSQGRPQNVVVMAREFYAVAELAAAAVMAQTAPVPFEYYHESCGEWHHRNAWTDELLADHSLYLRFSKARRAVELVYDPVVVTRRREAKEKRKARRPVPIEERIAVNDFNELVKAFRDRVEKDCGTSRFLHVRDYSACYNTGFWGAVSNLQNLFVAYHFLYGENSFRRVPEWQVFLKKWRKYGVGNHKKCNRCDDSHLTRFYKWLDEEALIKKPRGNLKLKVSRDTCPKFNL